MNSDILLGLILFMWGYLLYELFDYVRQGYIEKHIEEKHAFYSKSKWTITSAFGIRPI